MEVGSVGKTPAAPEGADERTQRRKRKGEVDRNLLEHDFESLGNDFVF